MTKPRRFGAREVPEGRQYSGSLHISTERYQQFSSELFYFHEYLNNRLLPTEPEAAKMQGILTNLQNLLEYEAEELIEYYVSNRGTAQEQQFKSRISNGYVSFKTKCDWLMARSLVTQNEWDVLEEIRSLRNTAVHNRPNTVRKRLKYKGFPLLTQASVRRMFVDVELTLRAIRKRCNRHNQWNTVPPGYASEMNWPAEYIDALEEESPTNNDQYRGSVDKPEACD